MKKDDLLTFWHECGQDVKSKMFFHTEFKKWIDQQEDALEAPQSTETGVRAKSGNRTPSQNSSIHLWLEMVASELDRHGHTVQNIVEKIKRAEIRPNKTVLKEVLWRPYQIAALGKESTTELTKHEVDKVYEGLNKFLAENFEMHIPFPSDESKGNDLIKAMDKANAMDYPLDIYEGQETGKF